MHSLTVSELWLIHITNHTRAEHTGVKHTADEKLLMHMSLLRVLVEMREVICIDEVPALAYGQHGRVTA